MRHGILEVGADGARLLVADTQPGSEPARVADRHWPVDASRNGTGLPFAVHEACALSRRLGVGDLFAFARAAFRQAPEADGVTRGVRQLTGAELLVLRAEDEAQLTFLAARRWCGWSAGRLLTLDVGAEATALAVGSDEVADQVASLPLGAARLTCEHLLHDPPRPRQLKRLRAHVDDVLCEALQALYDVACDIVVGTSPTLRALARVSGTASPREEAYRSVRLRRHDLDQLVTELAARSKEELDSLPGISPEKAEQLLATAVVAATTLHQVRAEELNLCPWGVREGVLLTRHRWKNLLQP